MLSLFILLVNSREKEKKGRQEGKKEGRERKDTDIDMYIQDTYIERIHVQKETSY